MSDKSVNGLVTQRKYAGAGLRILYQINYLLFLCKEVDRMYTVKKRHENRTNKDIVPIENWDADQSSPKLSFTKGYQFHFLPFLNEYLYKIYDEKSDNNITTALKEILDGDSDITPNTNCYLREIIKRRGC